jgi:hypothetical protein
MDLKEKEIRCFLRFLSTSINHKLLFVVFYIQSRFLHPFITFTHVISTFFSNTVPYYYSSIKKVIAIITFIILNMGYVY